MKLLLTLLLFAGAILGASWSEVQRISPGHKIQVENLKRENTRGTLVYADEMELMVRSKSGEHSIARADIRRVRIANPSHRVRNGLLSTAIGAGAGLAVGFAICPHCPNDGSPTRFTVPATLTGAGIGALGFLPTPYRTVYKVQ